MSRGEQVSEEAIHSTCYCYCWLFVSFGDCTLHRQSNQEFVYKPSNIWMPIVSPHISVHCISSFVPVLYIYADKNYSLKVKTTFSACEQAGVLGYLYSTTLAIWRLQLLFHGLHYEPSVGRNQMTDVDI